MSKALISYAISLAIATSAFAAGNANSNAGTNVGSNAGTNVGSNQGTTVGSNAGTNVGSNQGTNADHPGTPANPNTNVGSTAQNSNPRPRRDGFFGGIVDTSNMGVTSPDAGNPLPATPAAPAATGGQSSVPANGTTPAPTGPITSDGSLKTANVPPPGTYDSKPAAPDSAKPAAVQTQFEGQLVDLASANEQMHPTIKSTLPPASLVQPEAPPVYTPSRQVANDSTDGIIESVASVNKIRISSFGGTNNPESIHTPADIDATPTISTSNPKPEISIIIPKNKPVEPSLVETQLGAGLPAALLSDGHVYPLLVASKQLAPYAGKTVRVIGHLTQDGNLLAERMEAKDAGTGEWLSISLSKNDAATASER